MKDFMQKKKSWKKKYNSYNISIKKWFEDGIRQVYIYLFCIVVNVKMFKIIFNISLHKSYVCGIQHDKLFQPATTDISRPVATPTTWAGQSHLKWDFFKFKNNSLFYLRS